jgi:hypothetical protein
MALGMGPCSFTTRIIKKPSVELVCQWIKAMVIDLGRSNSQGFKMCCISDKINVKISKKKCWPST